MNIAETAEKLTLELQTPVRVTQLRFYEKIGLCIPERDKPKTDKMEGRRNYSLKDIAKLAQIISLGHLGYNHATMKMMYCDKNKDIIHEVKADIASKKRFLNKRADFMLQVL